MGTARAFWGKRTWAQGRLPATFYNPNQIAIDSSGNLYVADTSNSIIRKVTPAGIVTTLAGTALATGSADGTGAAARFFLPDGIAVDSSGNVFVADTYNSTIRKITPAGVVTTLAGTPGVTGYADGTGAAAEFNYPSGLGIDSSDNIYVADTDNSPNAHAIRKIVGNVVTTFSSYAFYGFPESLCCDAAGNVYVADTDRQLIRMITGAGWLAGAYGVPGSADGTGGAARFNYPMAVAADGSGNIWVADTTNCTIRKIAPGVIVTTYAGTAGIQGSTDGTGAAARFAQPAGIVEDGAGNLYVADTTNNTIRKIAPGGVVTTFVGVAGVAGHADS